MKIIMVCLGNICRSPLAEGIMQHLVTQEGLDWEIDSAGTGDWHVGEGPHRGSVQVAKKYGIDISGQICRLFRVSDFDTFDHILVMDKSNLSNILAMARNDADRKKVRLLLGDKEVPDPYLTNLFEDAYQLIEAGCKRVIEELRR
ncbi:low molecular weight protein-tyrosine-phosphatase [Mucilaginibacter myungsuensis]|uniref:protein-tyrosine-phosphatase n=1 Tax=Mucilaginibacter myungsuensis TaxID=649104 RepID=A0A929L0P2_9SPHI|nr:low molecular weight protein-tyrosine-phosphatase [Mucilaginibacter myungsuensis]MBE9663413.1 low molecular weight phosphotyrosine protein phosphatase [Mucilaginibacter myungsuensis]MDN3600149.1 low molecular weight protein-tyrosine-phosphatase [Mucilaginibacter myungsuensis]